MNDQPQTMNQPQMLNRDYRMWPPPAPVPPPPDDPMKYLNQPRPAAFPAPPKPGRGNWKGKVGFKKRKDNRRTEKGVGISGAGSASGAGGGGVGGGYKPPALHELQSQNRLKARRFYPNKKKFNNRFAPFAPRNTTSFIIRAKKSGGIASLVSPCPVTPAVLSTPSFSPSREVLGDMAKEQWGVDGYGSMNGLIRLRSPGNEIRDDEEDDDGGSSESDVEECVEVERRLNHDLSRFEMIYPNLGDENVHMNLSENEVDDQETHIARLEEENLTLKEKLFLMERELMDLRMKLQSLETGAKKERSNKDNSGYETLENEAGGIEGGGESHESHDDEALENEVGGGKIREETHDDDDDGARKNEVTAVAAAEIGEDNQVVGEALGESKANVVRASSEKESEGGGGNVCLL